MLCGGGWGGGMWQPAAGDNSDDYHNVKTTAGGLRVSVGVSGKSELTFTC